MFALQWAWDPIGQFGTSLAVRVAALRDCNRTLFDRPRLLLSLPTAELTAYLRQCWSSGGALMYAQQSLYAVCVAHALRFFERRQFLFLRYEDLMAMSPDDVLRLVGRFAGLHVDADVVDAARRAGRCTPRGGKRRPATYHTLSQSEKVLYNASAAAAASADGKREAAALFGEYNALLAELIHPDFRWQ